MAEVADVVVVGHVLFSGLFIDAGPEGHEAVALAPVAVLPEFQRRGVGAALIGEGLRVLAAGGHSLVLVLGDSGCYSRFGFSSELAGSLEHPYSKEAFMAMELVPGSLEGVGGRVAYPPPFEAA